MKSKTSTGRAGLPVSGAPKKGTASFGGTPRTRPPSNNGDTLPPHSDTMEGAALSCVLQAGDAGSQSEVDALLLQLRPTLFYDLRRRGVFEIMVKLRMEAHALDSVTLWQRIKSEKCEKGIEEEFDRLNEATNKGELFNFPEYLASLREFALRRWTMQKAGRMTELAGATELTPESLQNELADLYDLSLIHI